LKETSPQNSLAPEKSYQTTCEELSLLARYRKLIFLQIVTISTVSVLIVLVLVALWLPPVQIQQTKELTLQQCLREVLENLKQSQIEKDIFLFMSCYSYIFPTLDQKRKETQEIWLKNNITNMSFVIDTIKPIDSQRALAVITWTFNVHNLRTGEHKEYKQTFRVDFIKELEKLRIRSLEEINTEKKEIS
jgi:hypothetical protein